MKGTDLIVRWDIGSALGSTLRAAQASFVTTLAAGMGGLSWMLLVSLAHDELFPSNLNIRIIGTIQ